MSGAKHVDDWEALRATEHMDEFNAYMKKHRIHALFTDVIEELLVSKPKKPVDHLMAMLQERYPRELADWVRDDIDDWNASSDVELAERQARAGMYAMELFGEGKMVDVSGLEKHDAAAARIRASKAVAREGRRLAEAASAELRVKIQQGYAAAAPSEDDFVVVGEAVAEAAFEPWREFFAASFEGHMMAPNAPRLDKEVEATLRYNGVEIEELGERANSARHAGQEVVRLLSARADALEALWDKLATRGFAGINTLETEARCRVLATTSLVRMLLEFRRDANVGARALRLKPKPVLLVRMAAPVDAAEGASFFRRFAKHGKVRHFVNLNSSAGALDDVLSTMRRLAGEHGASFHDARSDWDRRLNRWRAALDKAAEAAKKGEAHKVAETTARNPATQLCARVVAHAVLRPGGAPPTGTVCISGLGGMKRTGLVFALARRWANRDTQNEVVDEFKAYCDWKDDEDLGAFEPYHETFLRNFDLTIIDYYLGKLDEWAGPSRPASRPTTPANGGGEDGEDAPAETDEEREERLEKEREAAQNAFDRRRCGDEDEKQILEAAERLPDDEKYLGNGIRGT